MPAEKNSLVANINRRKRAGKSRSKASSSISKESYEQMQQGWPNSAKKRAKKKTAAKKKASKKRAPSKKKTAAKKKASKKKTSPRR